MRAPLQPRPPAWDGGQHASPSSDVNELRGVAAVPACDIWAVGGTGTGALTEHWTGSGWIAVPGATLPCIVN